MPGALIERPQMTRTMYTALKKHIVRDRQKKKQEQEQDEALERLRKEREQKKKKEEEDNLNLEQTKEQITQLTRRMESLKNEKHELFSQLKKVLHQEDETKKKAQIKEQNELQSLAMQYPASIVPGHPVFITSGNPNRTKYMSLHQPGMPTVGQPQPQPQVQQQGIKRQRSPSPQPTTIYPAYSGPTTKFPPSSYHSGVKQESYSTPPKQSAYTAQSTHATYATQSGHTYQQSQPAQSYPVGAASAKYAASQSAFTSYPNHYAQHQKGLAEHPGYPQGYQVQRVPQTGYPMAPLHSASNLPLQQQLEQANQKAGFSEEKYKLQQQQMASAGLPPGQQAPVMTSQIAMSQHQGAPTSGVVAPVGKGSIVTGYPVRSQAVSTTYQSTSSAQVRTSVSHPSGVYTSSQVPRHPYAQQPGRSYY